VLESFESGTLQARFGPVPLGLKPVSTNLF
jgi:hypothetical protein